MTLRDPMGVKICFRFKWITVGLSLRLENALHTALQRCPCLCGINWGVNKGFRLDVCR